MKAWLLLLCLSLPGLAQPARKSYPVTFHTQPKGLWVFRYLAESPGPADDPCLGKTGEPLQISIADHELKQTWILYFCYVPSGQEVQGRRPDPAAMVKVRAGELAGWQRYPQFGELNVQLPGGQWRPWLSQNWALALTLAVLAFSGVGLIVERILRNSRRAPLPPTAPQALPWELETGQQIGAYRVSERLGEGATAVVYRVQSQGEQAALKLLKPAELRGTDVVARFRREMRTLSALRHPNLPYILDFGDYRGQFYLVMELLSGDTLKDRIDSGKVLLEQAQTWIVELARVLQTVHNQGILHRDIKPENLIFGLDRRIKLSDFGLARDQGATTVTAEGGWVGTPQYMAPELFQGARADHRSDQYSLGVLAFQLITGAPPFTGESPLALAMQHIQSEPPDPGQLYPQLSQKWRAALVRLLAKQPEDRFPNLDAFVAAVADPTT